MSIKIFSVGAPLPTAADFNTYLIQQQHVIKPSDESVVNSAVLQNDDHLVLPVQANTTYFAHCFILYGAANAADLAFKWSAPTGSVFNWISDALGSAAVNYDFSISRTLQGISNVPSLGGATSPVIVTAPIKGILTVGSTSGNLRATWSQGTADPATTVVKAGSMISLRRIV